MKSLIIPFINFAVFAAILIYLTRKKIAEFFQIREKKLRDEFVGYKTRCEAAEKEVDRLKQKMAQVEDEKNIIISQYKQKSEAVYKKIIDEAKAEADEMQCECNKIIDAEIEDMKKKIIGEFTDSIMAAVEKKADTLSESKKDELRKEFIELLSRKK